MKTRAMKEKIAEEEKKLEEFNKERPRIIKRQPMKEVFSVTKKAKVPKKEEWDPEIEYDRGDIYKRWIAAAWMIFVIVLIVLYIIRKWVKPGFPFHEEL